MRTLTFEEKCAEFGDPTPFIRADGTVDAAWGDRILVYAALPAPLPLSFKMDVKVVRFLCHRLLKERFEAALYEIHADSFAWGSVNDFGGCYAFRANRRDRRALSAHAWGIAIDLDVCDNPQGKEPNVSPVVVAAFERQGLMWGGRFRGKSRDGMHFEYGRAS